VDGWESVDEIWDAFIHSFQVSWCGTDLNWLIQFLGVIIRTNATSCTIWHSSSLGVWMIGLLFSVWMIACYHPYLHDNLFTHWYNFKKTLKTCRIPKVHLTCQKHFHHWKLIFPLFVNNISVSFVVFLKKLWC